MPTIFPIIRFHDSAAGLTWLKDVLGFEEHGVFRGEDGSVQHGELRHGDAWVMIGSDADLSSELEPRDYGGREFSLRDREGNIWSVGEYDPSRV
jgi:uncharacterized glyoxalase superfamily protein PhnB